jgi:hypothetical protein
MLFLYVALVCLRKVALASFAYVVTIQIKQAVHKKECPE